MGYLDKCGSNLHREQQSLKYSFPMDSRTTTNIQQDHWGTSITVSGTKSTLQPRIYLQVRGNSELGESPLFTVSTVNSPKGFHETNIPCNANAIVALIHRRLSLKDPSQA